MAKRGRPPKKISENLENMQNGSNRLGKNLIKENSMKDKKLEQIEGLTVKEAAYILQVSEKTIYGWISDKKLSAFKIGGSIRIKKEDIGAIQHSI